MFRLLGTQLARFWLPILILWVAVVGGLSLVSPRWESIVQDGEFYFLPENSPSHLGEQVFERAFSHDFLGSNIVVVVRRIGGMRREGLRREDLDGFIEKVLKPRLEKIAEEDGGYGTDDAEPGAESGGTAVDGGAGRRSGRSVITAIRTHTDAAIGHLLNSEDRQASLVMINLRTELFADQNRATLAKIERLIADDGDLRQERLVPAGLDLSLSGSATIGRDLRRAEVQSARSTEIWTLLLVVALLLAIYRSPVLAFIPLVTVFLAVKAALAAISLLALRGWIEPFSGIETYITVVTYGAGIDYCVFLMARYREELDVGATIDEAVAASVTKVGGTVVASALTTILGIGMMVFCQFGKFRQAGVGISLSLLFVLAASLTFTPALMILFGRWAFWPDMRSETIRRRAGWLSPTRFVTRLLDHDLIVHFWRRVANAIRRRPGSVFLATIGLMLPFALVAVACHDLLSYGLLSELSSDSPSVVGTEAVKRHFAAGLTGPVTLLIHNPEWDFHERQREQAIHEFTERLVERGRGLGLADVRSLSHPLGVTPAADAAEKETEAELRKLPGARRILERGVRRRKILQHYVSDQGEFNGHVTRIDVVFETDPFSRNSIRQFERFREEVPKLLPDELKPDGPSPDRADGPSPGQGTRLYFLGPTASILDLKRVTGHDQLLINVLVVVSVFAVLMAVVRQAAVAAYLIASVFFSYLVTLGLTYAVFYVLDPAGFAGLDWKVPVFLFTILIAVGEDYNIYLVARIQEEARLLGPARGTTAALARTGGVISTCGVIMAGTFASLMSGELTGMNQLGFALSFGVLLDTFVVRPILVPAYLLLLHTGRFGALGRFLGATTGSRADLEPSDGAQDANWSEFSSASPHETGV